MKETLYCIANVKTGLLCGNKSVNNAVAAADLRENEAFAR